MPKKLTILQQKNVVYYFQANTHNITQLAALYSVSRKTIYRVLKAYGIPTKKEFVMGEGQRVLELLKEYGVSMSRLRLLLMQDKKNRPVLPILTTAQMLLPLDTGEKQE